MGRRSAVFRAFPALAWPLLGEDLRLRCASGEPQVSLRCASGRPQRRSRSPHAFWEVLRLRRRPLLPFFPPEETEALEEVHPGSVVSARRPPRDSLPTAPRAGQGCAQLAAAPWLREATAGKLPFLFRRTGEPERVAFSSAGPQSQPDPGGPKPGAPTLKLTDLPHIYLKTLCLRSPTCKGRISRPYVLSCAKRQSSL